MFKVLSQAVLLLTNYEFELVIEDHVHSRYTYISVLPSKLRPMGPCLLSKLVYAVFEIQNDSWYAGVVAGCVLVVRHAQTGH